MDQTLSDLTDEAQTHVLLRHTPHLAKMLAGGLAAALPAGGPGEGELLHTAVLVFRDAPELLSMLLEAGFHPDALDSRGNTPFLAAAGFVMPAAMRRLLEAGADPFFTNAEGANAAAMLLRGPGLEDESLKEEAGEIVRALGLKADPLSAHCAELMREAGEWPEDMSGINELQALGIPLAPLGWSPMMLDLAMGKLSAGQIDAAGEADDLEHRDSWSRNLFLLAAWMGRVELLEALILKGCDPQATGHKGMNALHYAAIGGHIDLIAWLVELGLNLESRDSDENTALMLAVSHRLEAVAERLLDMGADIEAVGSGGNRVVHEATCPEMLSLLIRRGVDVTVPDANGYQAIHDTINMEMIDLLLDAGADVNAVSGGGSWILDDIAGQGNAEGVAHLLQRGAVADLTVHGKTALFSAASSGSLACVDVLLAAGVDVNAMDSDGDICLDFVSSPEMARHLLEKGANPFLSEDCGGPSKPSWMKDEVFEVFRQFRLSPEGRARWLQIRDAR